MQGAGAGAGAGASGRSNSETPLLSNYDSPIVSGPGADPRKSILEAIQMVKGGDVSKETILDTLETLTEAERIQVASATSDSAAAMEVLATLRLLQMFKKDDTITDANAIVAFDTVWKTVTALIDSGMVRFTIKQAEDYGALMENKFYRRVDDLYVTEDGRPREISLWSKVEHWKFLFEKFKIWFTSMLDPVRKNNFENINSAVANTNWYGREFSEAERRNIANAHKSIYSEPPSKLFDFPTHNIDETTAMPGKWFISKSFFKDVILEELKNAFAAVKLGVPPLTKNAMKGLLIEEKPVKVGWTWGIQEKGNCNAKGSCTIMGGRRRRTRRTRHTRRRTHRRKF
jgi:hypothetical protein